MKNPTFVNTWSPMSAHTPPLHFGSRPTEAEASRRRSTDDHHADDRARLLTLTIRPGQRERVFARRKFHGHRLTGAQASVSIRSPDQGLTPQGPAVRIDTQPAQGEWSADGGRRDVGQPENIDDGRFRGGHERRVRQIDGGADAIRGAHAHQRLDAAGDLPGAQGMAGRAEVGRDGFPESCPRSGL